MTGDKQSRELHLLIENYVLSLADVAVIFLTILRSLCKTEVKIYYKNKIQTLS